MNTAATTTTTALLKDHIARLRYTLDQLEGQLQRSNRSALLCANAAVLVDKANTKISQLSELIGRCTEAAF